MFQAAASFSLRMLAAITAGNWYVKIMAANCSWELSVEKATYRF
ncbi:MAG: hypothetical protein QXD61_10050 [Candidatus Caldarchaeum sp.]